MNILDLPHEILSVIFALGDRRSLELTCRTLYEISCNELETLCCAHGSLLLGPSKIQHTSNLRVLTVPVVNFWLWDQLCTSCKHLTKLTCQLISPCMNPVTMRPLLDLKALCVCSENDSQLPVPTWPFSLCPALEYLHLSRPFSLGDDTVDFPLSCIISTSLQSLKLSGYSCTPSLLSDFLTANTGITKLHLTDPLPSVAAGCSYILPVIELCGTRLMHLHYDCYGLESIYVISRACPNLVHIYIPRLSTDTAQSMLPYLHTVKAVEFSIHGVNEKSLAHVETFETNYLRVLLEPISRNQDLSRIRTLVLSAVSQSSETLLLLHGLPGLRKLSCRNILFPQSDERPTFPLEELTVTLSSYDRSTGAASYNVFPNLHFFEAHSMSLRAGIYTDLIKNIPLRTAIIHEGTWLQQLSVLNSSPISLQSLDLSFRERITPDSFCAFVNLTSLTLRESSVRGRFYQPILQGCPKLKVIGLPGTQCERATFQTIAVFGASVRDIILSATSLFELEWIENMLTMRDTIRKIHLPVYAKDFQRLQSLALRFGHWRFHLLCDQPPCVGLWRNLERWTQWQDAVVPEDQSY